MAVRAAIGLGSNVGDRRKTLLRAGRAIADQIGTVVSSSSLYETAPVGGPEQGPYLNGVVVIETELQAHEVLEHLLDIERAHGRERRERWGPRTLDLDLLLYGDEQIDRPGLTVPHPRMIERRFVLQPLLEVWPEATLPDGTRLETLLGGVADQHVVRLDDRTTPVASVAIFLTVGLLAVGLWWLMGLVLP